MLKFFDNTLHAPSPRPPFFDSPLSLLPCLPASDWVPFCASTEGGGVARGVASLRPENWEFTSTPLQHFCWVLTFNTTLAHLQSVY